MVIYKTVCLTYFKPDDVSIQLSRNSLTRQVISSFNNALGREQPFKNWILLILWYLFVFK